MTDTIFALASAAGRAAVAVVRLSGPRTAETLRRFGAKELRARRAHLRRLRAEGCEVLDEALVLWFPGPASYTGEDCAELQLHGGSAVVERVLGALARSGLRLAEPGEFTRRAFQNGKMDLDQAEGVADLIDAETEAQSRQALAQLGGALGRRHLGWRETLIDILAYLEAAVDFPDEEVPAEVESRAGAPLAGLISELAMALEGGRRGSRVREGYRVAIIGAPNAGKSSLFNALVGRDAAIVMAKAGTTRDILESSLVVNGYRVLLADMAGLRQTDEPVEQEGVRRALAWADAADARVWVVDHSDAGLWPREAVELLRRGDLCYLNKADRPGGETGVAARDMSREKGVSVVSGSLIEGQPEAVSSWLAGRVLQDLSGADFPATTRIRHVTLLSEALRHLQSASHMLGQPELAAEDVRLATIALGRVTGRVSVEDVLDQVFSSFCIGK